MLEGNPRRSKSWRSECVRDHKTLAEVLRVTLFRDPFAAEYIIIMNYYRLAQVWE